MNRLQESLLGIAILASVGALPAHAADKVQVVNEGGIRDKWMLADGVVLAAPGYPPAFAARGDNVCVAVGYAIKADGTTGDFTLLRGWNSSTAQKEPVDGFWEAFAQAGAGALSQWKFKPRPEVSTPKSTYTVATLHFMGKSATDVGELRNHCKISDLPGLVKANSQKSNKRNREAESTMQSLRNTQGTRIVENPGRSR